MLLEVIQLVGVLCASLDAGLHVTVHYPRGANCGTVCIVISTGCPALYCFHYVLFKMKSNRIEKILCMKHSLPLAGGKIFPG